MISDTYEPPKSYWFNDNPSMWTFSYVQESIIIFFKPSTCENSPWLVGKWCFFFTQFNFFFYFLHKLNKAVVSQSLSICMTGVLHSIMCQLCTKWITYSHGSITVSWYISLTSLLKLLDFTTMKSFTTFSQLWSLFASMISLPLKNKREIQCHLSLFFKRVILLTK